jgi:hypothetical protein
LRAERVLIVERARKGNDADLGPISPPAWPLGLVCRLGFVFLVGVC